MEHYKTVALLPMKANSERVTGKNFKNFCGKPLFVWTLEKLISIKELDKIIINTDAKNILEKYEIINNDKIILRDRPKDICGDLVSMNLIIGNDVENVSAKTYIMTHTTNPLTTKESFISALNKYEDGLSQGYDSLFSVNKIQNRFYDKHSKPINHDPNNLIRTQDLEPWFEENSNIYVFSKESFKHTNARIGLKPQMLEIDPIESTDIDNPSDWELAEILFNNLVLA